MIKKFPFCHRIIRSLFSSRKCDFSDSQPIDFVSNSLVIQNDQILTKLEQVLAGLEVPISIEFETSNSVIIEKKVYQVDFETLFTDDYFPDLEILIWYIQKRNKNIVELELIWILNYIDSKKWAAEIITRFSNTIIILIEVVAVSHAAISSLRQ